MDLFVVVDVGLGVGRIVLTDLRVKRFAADSAIRLQKDLRVGAEVR